jgi:hypothetical protein
MKNDRRLPAVFFCKAYSASQSSAISRPRRGRVCRERCKKAHKKTTGVTGGFDCVNQPLTTRLLVLV